MRCVVCIRNVMELTIEEEPPIEVDHLRVTTEYLLGE